MVSILARRTWGGESARSTVHNPSADPSISVKDMLDSPVVVMEGRRRLKSSASWSLYWVSVRPSSNMSS